MQLLDAPGEMGVLGLEPKTYALKVRCSAKLSYTPEVFQSLLTDSKRFGEKVNSEYILRRFDFDYNAKALLELSENRKSQRIISQSRGVKEPIRIGSNGKRGFLQEK